MEMLKFMAVSGWSLFVVSPFIWRFIFNIIDNDDMDA